jgi:hypothetical protein
MKMYSSFSHCACLEIKIELSKKCDMLKGHNEYDLFQDKGKYSLFGTSF